MVRNRDCLLGPGDERKTIPFNGPVLIGRRQFSIEKQKADLVYELRLRPNFQELGILSQNASVTLIKKVEPSGDVQIEVFEVQGLFESGEELLKEHVELRYRILLEQDFWIDSGSFLSPHWDKHLGRGAARS